MMKRKKNKKNCACSSKKKEKIAYGFIDYIVNKLPEIHIPGYQYCGPGTQLEKRLARGDPGINKLDQACKRHDIAYTQLQSSKERRRADKDLISQAFPRVYSSDAKLSERAAALLVSGLMSAKVGLSKIGLGLEESKKMKQKKGGAKNKGKGKRRSTKSKKQKLITFGKLLSGVKANVKKSKNKSAKLKDTIRAAIRTAKHIKRNKTVKMPRILKLPKYGGNVLPILPILSVLGAIGNISSSAASVVKTIRSIEQAKANNDQGEKKIGRGLLLSPNPNGSGFYLKPYRPTAQ